MRLLILTAALAAAIPASGDDAALRRCRTLSEAGARLACYDAISVPPSAQAAPVPAARAPAAAASAATPPNAATEPPREGQEARFGIERKAPAAELPAIQSHIPGEFLGWRPNSLIRLANGQVWQIADESARMMQRQDPRVTVRRAALGAFFLDFEGDNRSPRVRRVQ